MPDAAQWREDLDALQFPVPGHGGHCVIHRLAFRSLLRQPPVAADCLSFYDQHRPAFAEAARRKISRQAIEPGRNLHLNSRDIRRALAGMDEGTQGRACRVLGG